MDRHRIAQLAEELLRGKYSQNQFVMLGLYANWSWKSRWQLWFDRKLIPRTDLLVGNSQAVVEFYRRLGVPDAKLRVVHNGIDARRFIPFRDRSIRFVRSPECSRRSRPLPSSRIRRTLLRQRDQRSR